MKKKRSVGVTILGIMLICISLLFFFITLSELSHFKFDHTPMVFFEILAVISPLIILITAIGILLLKTWSRKFLLFGIPFFIFLFFFSCSFLYRRFDMCASLYGLGTPLSKIRADEIRTQLDLLRDVFQSGWKGILISTSIIMTPIIIYLTRPKVKRAFSERNPRTESGGDKRAV